MCNKNLRCNIWSPHRAIERERERKHTPSEGLNTLKKIFKQQNINVHVKDTLVYHNHFLKQNEYKKLWKQNAVNVHIRNCLRVLLNV